MDEIRRKPRSPRLLRDNTAARRHGVRENLVTADLVVRAGRVHGVQCDVVVDRGVIVALTDAGRGGPARRLVDASGLDVLPGAVDAHVHFDAPGRDDWEGWATGSLAAAAGGVTTVVDMPIDSHPPTLTAAAVRDKCAAATGGSLVDFALWGGLVPRNAEALHPLLDAGVVGLKAFLCDSGWLEFPACTPDALDRGMRAAATAGVPVAVHCEDADLFEHDGRDRPVTSEVAAVATAGAAAARHGARLHVVHCSSSEAVEESIRWPGTTVETCPHYLALDDRAASRIGPDAQCCPPVRDESNRRSLVRAVLDGRIDTIASDHSPCPPEEKEGDAPFAGVSGVQTTLSVLLNLDLPLAVIDRLRTAAARLCALVGKGALAVGSDADVALVDMAATWTVGPDTLHTRHRRSPFTGRVLPGVVRATLVRGEVVYQDGAPASEPIGRFLAPGAVARRTRLIGLTQ
jgi:allantoinase